MYQRVTMIFDICVVINYSPCTATTPLGSYTRLSRNYSLKRETPVWYMVGRVAVSTRTCPCRITLGPGVPRPCNLLLSPPTCTHPSYPTGSRSPTHPQQHPFPKPLHSTQPPSSPPSPLALQSFVGSEPTVHSQALMGRFSFWGGRVAGRQNFALSVGITFL
uniref:Uncharacterized protein n=1 Tax=Ursus americanus TaxID=9643 RepID=A0A452QL36_URSAM